MLVCSMARCAALYLRKRPSRPWPLSSDFLEFQHFLVRRPCQATVRVCCQYRGFGQHIECAQKNRAGSEHDIGRGKLLSEYPGVVADAFFQRFNHQVEVAPPTSLT